MLQCNQALTTAYSPHDLGVTLGIANKSEFGSAKNGLMYSVLTWREIRLDMHQTFMVNVTIQTTVPPLLTGP